MIILIFIMLRGSTQTTGDSLLFNENTLSRPLTLHKSQLRITAGYNFLPINLVYSGTEKQRLIDQGKAGIGNSFILNIRYGIVEGLELGLYLDYLNQNIREENVAIVEESVYNITFIEKTAGWHDPQLQLLYRFPLDRKLDVILKGDISFPISGNGNLEPEHQLVLDQASTDNSLALYNLNYVDRLGRGLGTLSVGYGALIKYRLNDKFAFTFMGNYTYPAGTSTNAIWTYELNRDNEFVYQSSSFDYQESDIRDFFFSIENQLFSTFNIYLGYRSTARKNGWSEETGVKRNLTNRKISNLSIGYELIATPKLWVSQSLDFPISGENDLAPVAIGLNFQYNLFIK